MQKLLQLMRIRSSMKGNCSKRFLERNNLRRATKSAPVTRAWVTGADFLAVLMRWARALWQRASTGGLNRGSTAAVFGDRDGKQYCGIGPTYPVLCRSWPPTPGPTKRRRPHKLLLRMPDELSAQSNLAREAKDDAGAVHGFLTSNSTLGAFYGSIDGSVRIERCPHGGWRLDLPARLLQWQRCRW